MKIMERIKRSSNFQKFLLVIFIILAILFFWRMGKKIFKSSDLRGFRQPAVAVEISPIETGVIRDIGQFSGTLIPKSQFVVAPKVSGKLKKLYINIGDRVIRGQMVAQLDDEEYLQQVAQADLKVARANLEEARNVLELARKELDRAEPLTKKVFSLMLSLTQSELNSGLRKQSLKWLKLRLLTGKQPLRPQRSAFPTQK